MSPPQMPGKACMELSCEHYHNRSKFAWLGMHLRDKRTAATSHDHDVEDWRSAVLVSVVSRSLTRQLLRRLP